MNWRVALLPLAMTVLALPLVGTAWPSPSQGAASQEAASRETGNPGENKITLLDQDGERGVVFFDHQIHEVRAQEHLEADIPDTDTDSAAEPNREGSCSSCHHSRRANGVPELAACGTCHRNEGHSQNPVDLDGHAIGRRLAFHGACIECHRETSGPTLCGGCHKMAAGVIARPAQ